MNAGPKSEAVDLEMVDCSNRIEFHIGDGIRPRLIVNGVDLAPKINRDWSLVTREDESGLSEVLLTVTFPVTLP